MLNDYNYKRLKDDFRGGKQIVLFVGAGINFCKKNPILWSDVMGYLFEQALVSIACDKEIKDEDLARLRKLFNIKDGSCKENLSIDLHKFVQDEYPSVLQAYIVKKILGYRYISIIQDYLYNRCNTELIKKAFEANHTVGNESTSPMSDYPCLFEIARLILLSTNIRSVVTYNYDNFLTQAVNILQNDPERYFTKDEREILRIRQSDGILDVVDIYGDRYDQFLNKSSLPVYHVHGYIPPPNESQSLDDTSIILSLDEFYDNVRNVYSWQTDTQIHLLSHYTCVFVGTSISDITIQRMIYYAQHYGNNENIYYFRAYQIPQGMNETEIRLHELLTGLKNDFYNDYGLSVIYAGAYKEMYKLMKDLVSL